MRLTLYIADRKTNDFMAAVDLCPSYKVFVKPIEQETERKGVGSDEDFINRIIQLSKSEKDYWIPAVKYNGFVYADEGIREISDGNKIMFIQQGVAA